MFLKNTLSLRARDTRIDNEGLRAYGTRADRFVNGLYPSIISPGINYAGINNAGDPGIVNDTTNVDRITFAVETVAGGRNTVIE